MKYSLLLVLLLTGCICDPVKPTPPVIVPCVKDIPVRPALVTNVQLKGTDDFHFAPILIKDRQDREGYMKQLEAVLESCR
jgi:hypothetical protein